MHRSRYAVVAVMLAVALITAPSLFAQQGEQEQKSVEGSLKMVNLEENKIVIEKSDESEVTLVLTADTKIQSPEGETTVAALEGKEGTVLRARFVQNDQGNVALMIVMVTD